MKTSTIKISSNVLKGIMEFRSCESPPFPYGLSGIGFSMDNWLEKDHPIARYHVSDGHIGITGTCGPVEGARLPKSGVALPATIYPQGVKLDDETDNITLKIDHEGFVTTLEGTHYETRVRFEKGAKHVPMLRAIPAHFGGTDETDVEQVADVLMDWRLATRVLKGLALIVGENSNPAIRITFFGKAKQVVFTSQDSEFDFVAAQMPMRE